MSKRVLDCALVPAGQRQCLDEPPAHLTRRMMWTEWLHHHSEGTIFSLFPLDVLRIVGMFCGPVLCPSASILERGTDKRRMLERIQSVVRSFPTMSLASAWFACQSKVGLLFEFAYQSDDVHALAADLLANSGDYFDAYQHSDSLMICAHRINWSMVAKMSHVDRFQRYIRRALCEPAYARWFRECLILENLLKLTRSDSSWWDICIDIAPYYSPLHMYTKYLSLNLRDFRLPFAGTDDKDLRILQRFFSSPLLEFYPTHLLLDHLRVLVQHPVTIYDYDAVSRRVDLIRNAPGVADAIARSGDTYTLRVRE